MGAYAGSVSSRRGVLLERRIYWVEQWAQTIDFKLRRDGHGLFLVTSYDPPAGEQRRTVEPVWEPVWNTVERFMEKAGGRRIL